MKQLWSIGGFILLIVVILMAAPDGAGAQVPGKATFAVR